MLLFTSILILPVIITVNADSDIIVSEEPLDQNSPLSLYDSNEPNDNDNNALSLDITSIPITFSNAEDNQSKTSLIVNNFYELKDVIENNNNIEITIAENITFTETIQINNKNFKFISTKPNIILTITAGRHFNITGENVILEFDGNIILDGNNTGGGIGSTSAHMMLNNAIIQNCITSTSGGGICSDNGNISVVDSIISNNTAGSGGGGIYCASGTVDINNSEITYNRGTSGGGISGNNITINAGAIIAYNTANEGGGITANRMQSVINIYGGSVEYNEAMIGGGIFCPSDSTNNTHSIIHIDGGAINYNKVNASYESTGAGVAAKNGTHITMENGEIKGNTFKNVIGRGAGIGIDGNGTGVSEINITGGEINGNGKPVDGKGGTNQGGGIYINSDSILNISGNAKIINNTATSGGGIFSNVSSTVNIYGQAEITDNIATASGGALWIYGIGNNSTSNLNIYENAKILRNKALNGGGIRVIGGNTDTVNVKVYDNAVISGNIAEQGSAAAITGGNGGAICDYYYSTEYYFATVNIDIYGNAMLEENSASNEKGSTINNTGGRGGGIYAESIKTRINIYGNAQIKANEAASIGGGICVYGNGSNSTDKTHLNIYGDAKISKNRAFNGGGIYAETSKNIVNISDWVQISDNIADVDGGGIWIQHKDLKNLTVGENIVFSGNKASNFYLIASSDADLHEKQIQTFTFTNPFNNAYNNYDIRYSSVTVTFESNGGSAVNPIAFNEYEIGNTIDEALTTTSKEAYEFRGWYKDSELTQIWNFDDGVTENIILYAKWEQRLAYAVYTVKYDSNGAMGGKVPVDKNAYEGSAKFIVLDNAGDLVKNDYIFSGWNELRNSTGQKFEIGKSYPVNSKNNILYAQWSPVSTIPSTTEPEVVTTMPPTSEPTTTEPTTFTESPAEPTTEAELVTNPPVLSEIPTTMTKPEVVTTTPPVLEPTTTELTTIAELTTEPTIEPSAEQIIGITAETEVSTELYVAPNTEPVTDFPVNAAELPKTETSIILKPANSMAAVATAAGNFEVEIYEDIPDNAVPLSNGWFAVHLGNDIYEIFDENGVPLGLVVLEDTEDIKEWKNFDNLIPLTDLTFITIPEKITEKNTNTPSHAPQTDDSIIFALLKIIIICILAVVIIEKKLRRK